MCSKNKKQIKEFSSLPKWLQELWSLSPTIARQAEKYLEEQQIESKEINSLTEEQLKEFKEYCEKYFNNPIIERVYKERNGSKKYTENDLVKKFKKSRLID